MGIIDYTYFTRDINLPDSDLEELITPYIDQYEEELLIEMMGQTLYDKFDAGKASIQIYKDIVDGKLFQFDLDGRTIKKKWIGLDNIEMKSVLAYYVYFKYREDTVRPTSGVGANVVAAVENSTIASAAPAMTRAWNNHVLLRGVPRYYDPILGCCDSYSHIRGYCGFFDTYDQSTYDFGNDWASFYNFMLANISDYPDWEFKPTTKINQFGI